MQFPGPSDAIAAGIGMVHQHFMLVARLHRRRERHARPRADRGPRPARPAKARRDRCASCPNVRLEVDPDALVEDLPVGVQQRVEIIKALANDAKELILDEPTAVLTPQEIDELMAIMRSLQGRGHSIVFITHKLREVKAIADKITVIRRGKVVGTAAADDRARPSSPR